MYYQSLEVLNALVIIIGYDFVSLPEGTVPDLTTVGCACVCIRIVVQILISV